MDNKLSVPTPTFFLSLESIAKNVGIMRTNAQQQKVLYSTKSLGIVSLLEYLDSRVDGFSVSSRFEVKCAQAIAGEETDLHFVGVVVRLIDLDKILASCNRYTANSIVQFQAATEFEHDATLGLRVNPRLSVTCDQRYDPCRRLSKLGVPLDKTLRAWREGDLNGISGIHFHTACECRSWEPLLRTVEVIEERLAPMLHELEWINLGGGYRWDEATDFGPLQEAIELLTNRYGLEVFLEPGHGIVNSAGSLHASVVDLFESDGKMVAILDTTVNHLPEVYEYQYEPDVAEHLDGAPHEYILAGCSCLAGDVFGEYAFEEPLEIGSRIVFENVGAYSLVKANMFNGINLPSIYILQEDGRLELIREFTYEDYLARCGGDAHAVMPAGV